MGTNSTLRPRWNYAKAKNQPSPFGSTSRLSRGAFRTASLDLAIWFRSRSPCWPPHFTKSFFSHSIGATVATARGEFVFLPPPTRVQG